jgi:predicted transcriptional regulator
MARQKSSHLTESELRLMEVLWSHSPATVAEVLERLPAKPPLAYSTVITTLRILETKGYVRHIKDGRAFQYEPLVARNEARRTALRQMMHRLFEGSPELLMATLFESGEIDRTELQRLRKLIEKAAKPS